MTDAASSGPEDDERLLARAELAFTQIKNAHGLTNDQQATLAAIRLRLEGIERASLDDLLRAGRDRDPDAALGDALNKAERKRAPSFDELAADAQRRRGPSLDDLL